MQSAHVQFAVNSIRSDSLIRVHRREFQRQTIEARALCIRELIYCAVAAAAHFGIDRRIASNLNSNSPQNYSNFAKLQQHSSFSFTGSAATQTLAKHEPMFITRSETFKFVAGETIHLPCEVSNTGT